MLLKFLFAFPVLHVTTLQKGGTISAEKAAPTFHKSVLAWLTKDPYTLHDFGLSDKRLVR